MSLLELKRFIHGVQSVSAEESLKHEKQVLQQAQFIKLHSCPDHITLAARVKTPLAIWQSSQC